MKQAKVRIGIYELTGCAGDALLILDCEKDLLEIFSAADIMSFTMAKSDNIDGPLDLALVEGSVTTERDIDELKDIRKRASTVVAIGLCATAGGIQGRFQPNAIWEADYKSVYKDAGITHTKPIQSKPIDAYIEVDYYLPGCPIGKEQFLHFFARMIRGNPPEKYPRPVCAACKHHENPCLLKEGFVCLGPITADGCGSICPNHNLPCVGCWGSVEAANYKSEYHLLKEKGYHPEFIRKKLGIFHGAKIGNFITYLEKERP